MSIRYSRSLDVAAMVDGFAEGVRAGRQLVMASSNLMRRPVNWRVLVAVAICLAGAALTRDWVGSYLIALAAFFLYGVLTAEREGYQRSFGSRRVSRWTCGTAIRSIDGDRTAIPRTTVTTVGAQPPSQSLLERAEDAAVARAASPRRSGHTQDCPWDCPFRPSKRRNSRLAS